MPDEDLESPEDPWLTLAEIAEELRMSPATIRTWIARGTLRAMRPGTRKWLVRRSELDRMLAARNLEDPDRDDWRPIDTVAPPRRSPHWLPEASEHVTSQSWLGLAETEWRNALRASASAPPDISFITRLRDIAEAAARKAAAFGDIDEPPGPWWQRQTSLPSGGLSYELRPAAVRPGPPDLWARFDRTVDELAVAMESRSVPAEQAALEQVSLLLREIADALQDRGEYPWPIGWAGRPDDGIEGSDGGEVSIQ